MVQEIVAASYTPLEYVFVNQTPVKLTSIIGGQAFISNLSIRAGKSNAGEVNFGGSNLTYLTNRGGYLDPGEALDIDLVNKFFSSDQMYVCGLAGDRIHIQRIA